MISLGGRTGLCLGLAFWLGVNCAFPSAGSEPLLLGEWSTELPCEKADIAAALTKWMNALTALGRYDASEKCWIVSGNDLFVPAHGDCLATVYISGPQPWDASYTSNKLTIRCCTMAHLLLGPEAGNQLILDVIALRKKALKIPASKSSKRREEFTTKTGIESGTMAGGETLDDEAQDSVLQKKVQAQLGQYAKKLQDYVRRHYTGLSEEQIETIAFYNDGSYVQLDKKTHDTLTKLTHTERMLVYHHNGALPNGLVIYSRYSMCKSCEPAVVRAAGNNQVWVISRCVYNKSYIAGKTNASVKKAVVYSDGNAVPIKDLWTYKRDLHAYNISIDTFGGDTWQAEH